MQFLKFAFFLAAVSVALNLSLAQTHPEADGGIEGIITISPIRPGPIRQDMPSAGPFANGTFTVQNQTGTVTSFTTNGQGRFRVSLPPGHYTVSRKDSQRGVGHFGPFEV